MNPSDEPPAFEGSTRVGHSPLPAYAVIVGAILVVGFGFVSSLADDGNDEPSSPLPTASAPVAAATTRPTPRPTPVPTPVPTPRPTLSPTFAPATTARLGPTGVLVADIGDPTTGDLVADVDGTIWTTREGAVVNVDLRSGRTREWTLADDPAFAEPSLALARAGGVWLVGPDAIRHFDGTRFPAVIETPVPVWSVVEDPGGSLWAQTERYGLVRWTDGVWISAPPGRPARDAADIAVDSAGRVWTIDYEQHQDEEVHLGVSAWSGSTWTSFTADDLPGLPGTWGWDTALVTSGDGSVWVKAGWRLARFWADRWEAYEVAVVGPGASLRAVGDDGRLWFVQEDCAPEPCGIRIHAWDGSTLTIYDEADGLPGADDVDWPGGAVLPTPGSVLASTEAGLYRLTDGSWQRLELSSPPGASTPGSSLPGGVWDLAASSRDEVWVATEPDDRATDARRDGGLFHFDGAAWRQEPLPAEATIGRMAIGPDGALWVATSSGPLVRREGTWLDLGDAVGSQASGPAETDVGCGGTIFIGDGVVYYAGPRSANRLVELHPTGDTWEASLHAPPTLSEPCWSTMAATADGTVWLLDRGWGSSLSRSVGGGPWEDVSLPPVEKPDSSTEPTAIAVDRDGTLWVVTHDWEESDLSRTVVWQLDEGRWIHRGGGEGIGYVADLAPLADGSLIAVGEGLTRFDGERWRRLLDGVWLGSVSVAPDGAVWVSGATLYRLPPSLP